MLTTTRFSTGSIQKTAGTVFWIDPVENLVVVSMMQLMGGWPSYRPDLRVASYQAIIESNE